MRLVGFDGKKIKKTIKNSQGSTPQQFEALLGIGVTVNDYNLFMQEYDKIIDNSFKNNSLVRNKVLYKGSDLTAIFYGKGIDLISELIQQLLSLVTSVDIYFHYIPPYYDGKIDLDKSEKISNKIGVYYEEEIEHLSNVQFIDLIEHHFPALCCYSYLQELNSEIKGTLYCIDECPNLLQSKAIVSIIKHPNTRFLFRGDQINYVVNAADIFCRYIEERTKNENIIIDRNLVRILGLPEDKVKYHYIGSKWLNVIKPSRRGRLNISYKYPHPIYFLFSQTKSAFIDSRNLIENSALYREALKKASYEGGSVKFFESQDQDYINDSDFLITHTEDTDEKTKELKRIGCGLTP